MQSVLTIAGFDPSSGAGVTADLSVFAAHGLFGTACITSLTIQSTVGVRSVHPVEPRVVEDTLNCLGEDLPPSGIKIGMLGTAGIVESVSIYLERLRAHGKKRHIVVDPVLRSSSGRELLDPVGLDLLRSRLLPLADWVTPNLEELSILSNQPVTSRDEIISAAEHLHKSHGNTNILVTGGHLNPPDDFLLTVEGTHHWLAGERVHTRSTHGTGCAFSSALVSRLVLGASAEDAAKAAKDYVTEGLRSATPIGHGNGPLNLLWPLLR